MIRVSLKKSKALRVPLVVGMLAAGLAATATTPALAQSSGTWTRTGDMKNARDGAAAILLQNGQVLVAGGNTNTVQFATAELYNPANGHWTLTGSMNTANPGALTLLQNGQVLSNGADVELYNPSTGKWTVTGSMHTARYNFTQTSLPTGKVLVAGGYDKTCPSSCPGLSSAELYDPSTGTWSMTGSMHTGRWAHTATLLANGLVLVAGGYEGPGASNGLASAELYNPATGQWTNTGSMNTVRIEQFAALLTSGQVLVLFGDGTTITRTELYNPGTGTWTVNGNTGATAQFSFSVTLLNTGKVLIAGGANCVYPRPCVEVSSAELYDPSVGASTFTGSLNIARSSHSATLLANGQVLAAGGQTENNVHKFSFTNSAELYTP